MARRGRTCVVEGCERKAAMASVVCQEHRETALGEQTDREILKMTQRLTEMGRFEDAEERREAVQTFRRQVARGDYAALFSSEMVNALDQKGKGYGMQQEIGMMRVAMLRLMLEEENPSRMAHGLAKLSGALGKSMERQEEWEKADRQRRSYAAYQEAVKNFKSHHVEEERLEDAELGPEGQDVEEMRAPVMVATVEEAVDPQEFQDENGFIDADAWFRERDRAWAAARLEEIGKSGAEESG